MLDIEGVSFDREYAKACVTLEPLALEEEFVRFAADLASWGEQAAQAKREVGLRKMSAEVVAAQLDGEARTALAGDKKPTEASIAAWVQQDPRRVAAEKEVIDAEYHSDRVRAVLDAVRAKRDMLVGLGAAERITREQEPVIRERGRG
jgi:hypothetical protein